MEEPIITATADYLKIKYHLVGTSNNRISPVTMIGREENQTVFHIGYTQDTTDQPGAYKRGGHYQGLRTKDEANGECCKASPKETEKEMQRN